MKKILKILGLILLALILVVILAPFLFKGDIIKRANEEINKNVEAQVEFSDIKLSLIRYFPNFSLQINDLTVVGIDEFDNDTLANIESVFVSIDILSVIKGEDYKVRKIRISEPELNLKVLENGHSNWDIAVSSDKPVKKDSDKQSNDSATTTFNLSVRRFDIEDGKLRFNDKASDISLVIEGFNHGLSGDLTADITTLSTYTEIDRINFGMSGIDYVENVKMILKADLIADLVNNVFTFDKNHLELNDVNLGFDGRVKLIEEDIDLDLTLLAEETSFKDILSLVPAFYISEFSNIDASGELSLDGFVKGIYNENTYPAFKVGLNIDNGSFKYPDLPSSVNNINIQTIVNHTGGDLDNAVIDISKFHFELADNPFDLVLAVKTLISDPEINAVLKGKIDLKTIKQVYPFDDNTILDGLIITDFSVHGKVSDIENEQYANVTSSGFIEIDSVVYKTGEQNNNMLLHHARLDLSPEFIELSSCNMNYGSSDIGLKGKIWNYIPYAMDDGILYGSLAILSDYLNIDELLDSDKETEEEQVDLEDNSGQDTTSVNNALVIPDNIDLLLITSIKKLTYNKLEIENAKGLVKVHNNMLILDEFDMRSLGGKFKVNGFYDSQNPGVPVVDMKVKIEDFDVQQSYNSFALIKEFAPVVKRTNGTYSTDFSFTSELGPDMIPVFQSILGGGELLSSKIVIEDIQVVNQIADILKMDQLKNATIDEIDLTYEFVDGKAIVNPFDFKIANINANLSGYTSLDKSINYILEMDIPRKAFGDNYTDVLGGLEGAGDFSLENLGIDDILSLGIIIGGTIANPEIRVGVKDAVKNVVDQIKQKAREELENKKEELEAKAREEAEKYIAEAQARADQIMANAQQQADNIMNIAQLAADQVIIEADTAAAIIVAEGKKNGYLAEIAARKAGDELKSGAVNKSNKILNEAQSNADKLLNSARQEADKIMEEAYSKFK